MKKTIIIEGDKSVSDLIQNYLSYFPQIQIEGVFSNRHLALEFLKNNTCDLAIFDKMLNYTTIEALEKLTPQPPRLIIISAEPIYASTVFNSSILDFLDKPFTKQRFDQSIVKFLKLDAINQKNEKEIFLKEGKYTVAVNKDEIVFIQGYGEYLKVHMADKKTYVILSNFEQIQTSLGSYDFVRCHRSYIINRKHLLKIAIKECVLSNHHVIPISKRYRKFICFETTS